MTDEPLGDPPELTEALRAKGEMVADLWLEGTIDLLLGAGEVGEETADEILAERSTLTGAGAAFLGVGVGELELTERDLETEGEAGLAVVLGLRFNGGVVLVRGVGVGASPDFIPNSDNKDFLFVTDGVLPTEALSVIVLKR